MKNDGTGNILDYTFRENRKDSVPPFSCFFPVESGKSCREASANAGQGQPVADRQHADVDPLIVAQLEIERAQRRGVWILILRIGDGAAPQDVVDGDEAARADQRE